MTTDYYDADNLMEHIEKKMFGSPLQKFVDGGFMTQEEADRKEKDAEFDAKMDMLKEEKEESIDHCFCKKCGDDVWCDHSDKTPHEASMCGNCVR